MKKELLILKEVESAKGTGSQSIKQKLISDNLTDMMKYLLKVAFDPFVLTKINKATLEANPTSTVQITFDRFKALLEKLINAPSANNDLRQQVYNLINGIGLNYEERLLLVKIITKSLNIGLGAKLINKAVGSELILDPSAMLAQDEQSEIEKWESFYSEEKLDGIRLISIVKDNDVLFYTRNFNILDNRFMSNLRTDILSLHKLLNLPDNWFFDGELTDLKRQTVSGKITQIIRETASNDIDKDFIYHIFDIEKEETLKKGKGTLKYGERRELLNKCLIPYLKSNPESQLRYVERYLCTNSTDSMVHYKNIVKAGGEGIICKSPEHYYECKRSKNWIKLKEVNDCDLIITGWYEGRKNSKREGKLGGFNFSSSCGLVKVDCGSGLNDELLDEISKNPESYIGKIVKILYNVKIKDKHGNYSLFLPRIEEIRVDKTEPDSFEKIK